MDFKKNIGRYKKYFTKEYIMGPNSFRPLDELPPAAIRELIVNAVVHRNYIENSCIQIAIYDDRLEVTSPGGFPKGVTIDRVKSGFSKVIV